MIAQGKPAPIRVVLADGQRFSRDSFALVLKQALDFELVGLVSSGLNVVERVVALQPSVAVLDAALTQLDAVTAVSALTLRTPATRIVAMLPDTSQPLLEHLATAGATSIVLRSISPETLLEVIRAAARGDGLLQREVLAIATAVLPSAPSPAVLVQDLTPRESQVLTLVGRHCSNRAIADELRITENTVKKHVKNILAKLQVPSRREAARYASNGAARRLHL